MHQRRVLIAAAILLTTTLTFSGSATPALGQAAGAYGNLVFVPVKVTDSKKAYAHGLKREQFRVLEDGVEQKVTYFSEDGPWNIEMILGLDILRSDRPDPAHNSVFFRDAVRSAVAAFKTQAGADNQYNVDDLPFGSNGLYDAIFKGIDRVSKISNPRKALVVIADGFDSPGGDPGAQLVEYAKKFNIPIYSIFIREGNDTTTELSDLGRGNRTYGMAGQIFQQLADITGGSYLASDVDHELEKTVTTLALDLKNMYVLGFTSTNDAKDNKYRKLELKVTPPAGVSKLNLSAKSKYFVPKEKK